MNFSIFFYLLNVLRIKVPLRRRAPHNCINLNKFLLYNLIMFEDKYDLVSKLAYLCRETDYDIKSPVEIDLTVLLNKTVELLNYIEYNCDDIVDIYTSLYNVVRHFSKIKRAIENDKFLQCFNAAFNKPKKIKKTSKEEAYGNINVSNIYRLNPKEIYAHGLSLNDNNECIKFLNVPLHKIKLFADSNFYINTKKNSIYGKAGDKVCTITYDTDWRPRFDQDTRFEIYFMNEESAIYQVYEREYLNSLKPGQEPDAEKTVAIFFSDIPDEKTNLGYANIIFNPELCNEEDIEFFTCLGACLITSFETTIKKIK